MLIFFLLLIKTVLIYNLNKKMSSTQLYRNVGIPTSTYVNYNNRARIVVRDIAVGSLADLPRDGVSDCSAAIQNALDKGGLVQLPSGTFMIGSTLEIKNNFATLQGAGNSTVLKLMDGKNVPIIKVDQADFVTIQDLFIDGNKANQASGNGVEVYRCYRCLLLNVTIDKVKDTGLYSSGISRSAGEVTSLTTTIGCIIQSCGQDSIQHNLYSQDPQHANTYTQDAGRYGLFMNGNFGGQITDCHFFRNGDHGVLLLDGGRHNFVSCNSDLNQNWGFVLSGTNTGSYITGCRIFDNNQAGAGLGGVGAISLDGTVKRCVIMGNVIYDEQLFKTQTIGIKLATGTTENTIVDNSISDAASGKYDLVGNAALNNTVIASESNKYNLLNTTESTSEATGCLVLSGGLGVGKTAYVNNLICDDDSSISAKLKQLVIKNSESPASGDAGTPGSIIWDADYLYVCTASGAWKRVALTGLY